MIVKDEELALPRVLGAAKSFADEIIVVDTGSSDKTREIAAEAGCKVFDFVWQNDFSAARNKAFSEAACDYLMWLDADDVITPPRAQELAFLKATLTADMVMLPYFMGEPPKLTFWRERILKRDMGFVFEGRVHESIPLRGNVVYADIPIVHDKLKQSNPKRNLNIYNEMLAQKVALMGRDAFYYGSELYYNGMNEDADFWLNSFIEGAGSPSDKGQACLFSSRTKRTIKARRKALIKGLGFAFSPDLLCELGDTYMAESDFRAAKACFLTALCADENITFRNPEAKDYLPDIRLCCCYWHLGDKVKAKLYNNAALKAKPGDEFALKNASLFAEQ